MTLSAPSLPIVATSHPLLSPQGRPDEIRKRVELILDEVLLGLTGSEEELGASFGKRAEDEQRNLPVRSSVPI